MKIKQKQNKNIKSSCCNNENSTLYQLDGWDKKDWLCAECFVRELIESEAEYQIFSKQNLKEQLKELDNYKKAYNILMDYFDCINDEEKPKVDKQLKRLGL